MELNRIKIRELPTNTVVLSVEKMRVSQSSWLPTQAVSFIYLFPTVISSMLP